MSAKIKITDPGVSLFSRPLFLLFSPLQMNRLLNIFYILFCFQIGVFLLLYPWLRIWEVNGLLIQHPALRQIMMNNYFRGAVSGLGILNLLIGAIEFVSFTRKKNSH